MSRRTSRSACGFMAVTSWPLKRTSPALGSISRKMQRPVVDLPQPDSPTMPRVSPAAMLKLTPSTACTRSTSRLSSPPLIGKYLVKPLTCKSSGAWSGAWLIASDACAAWGKEAVSDVISRSGKPPGDPMPVHAARASRTRNGRWRADTGAQSGNRGEEGSTWAQSRE